MYRHWATAVQVASKDFDNRMTQELKFIQNHEFYAKIMAETKTSHKPY